MGSQWNGMGQQLLKIEPFKNSILASDEILKSEGISIHEMITKSTDDTFKYVVGGFVGIVTIQVKLLF